MKMITGQAEGVYGMGDSRCIYIFQEASREMNEGIDELRRPYQIFTV